MMKKFKKLAVVALSSLFALSLFAACGKEDPPEQPEGGAGVYSRICFDNLAAGYVSEADTKITLSGKLTDVAAKNAEGESVETEEIVSLDTATNTFTAVAAGTVDFKLDGIAGRIEVVPAYVTDPGNAYTGKASDYNEAQSNQLGGTHDPSFISREEAGKTVYYLFSTGWNNLSNYNGENTFGNAIHISEDGMKTWQFAGRTFDRSTRDEMLEDSGIEEWLYGGTCNGYGVNDASWWAPDIVEAPDGGYWLYTCVVDGSADNEGMLINGKNYARAACLLFYSDDLYQGTFEYKGVLMQSSIQRGESVRDVNGIDPQIIYTPDGKMYMAYGSFGSGNWMIELDPETGLRKDGKGWQTHETIRGYVENDVQTFFSQTKLGESHEYYGTYISKADMEAPVIARHDNVVIADETQYDEETGELKDSVTGKTYYYSMHSYYGLGEAYQMWGGRSESVTGVYHSATGEGNVVNMGFESNSNQGNKYMGAFTWSNKTASAKNEIDIILPGHNDLYTSKYGTNLAAYITRTLSYSNNTSETGIFLTQVHQYYLNSMGDICINPNRYGGEIDRAVSETELLALTDGGKFKMVAFKNARDTVSSTYGSSLGNYTSVNKSVDVVLTEDGAIRYGSQNVGTWLMYGKGYIKFTFNANTAIVHNETVFYGVVRPAWLGDQNRSGFTITCMSHTPASTRSMAMFMNGVSKITGDDLVG